MDNISIAIITEDLDYGETLGACLGYFRRDFIISLYQRKDLGDFPDSDFDVILLDGETEDQRVRKLQTVIQLCEKKSSRVMNLETGLRKIWRYEKIDAMVRDIICVFEHNSGKTVPVARAQNTKMIGFISPCGGSGCTSVTWACLQELCRFFRKKVLYISMEETESSSDFIRLNEKGRNPDEFIYEALELKKTDETVISVDSFLCSDEYGVNTLLPFRGRNSLKALNGDELNRFFEVLKKAGDFDYIGIDFGCSMGKTVVECYSFCDRICFITDATRKRSKEKKVLMYLEALFGKEFADSMIFVENKCVAEINASDNRIKIDFDRMSFCGEGVTRIATDKKFGMAIRKLVKELMS